jgi:hypothetical protein
MFLLLAEVVESDVKAMSEVTPSRGTYAFSRIAEDRFSVTKQVNMGGFTENDAVVFVLERQAGHVAIRVGRKNPKAVTATPSVNPLGECGFQVEGKHMELWQVSRAALENFFFRNSFLDT